MAEATCKCLNKRSGKLNRAREPFKCDEIPGRVHSQCRKPSCYRDVAIDFGSMSKADAMKALANLGPMECPGSFHTELSFWGWWQFDKVVAVAFPAQKDKSHDDHANT
jgi:hypothetical protein